MGQKFSPRPSFLPLLSPVAPPGTPAESEECSRGAQLCGERPQMEGGMVGSWSRGGAWPECGGQRQARLSSADERDRELLGVFK